VDGLAHTLVARGVWMQMIAGINLGGKIAGPRRIAHDLIEIHDAIKDT